MGSAAGGAGDCGGSASPAEGEELPDGGTGTCATPTEAQSKTTLAPRNVRSPAAEAKRPMPEQHRQTGSIVKPGVL